MFVVFTAIFAIFMIIFDQIIKIWTISTMSVYDSYSMIPGLIDITYVQNKGAAWSMLSGRVNFLIIISILSIIYFLFLSYKHRQADKKKNIIYGLIIGGACGNLIDRLVYGFVIDMIDLSFIDFPIFNIADILISLGMFLLCLMIITKGEAEVL